MGKSSRSISYESAQQANADAAGIAPDRQQVVGNLAGTRTTVKVSRSSGSFYKKDRLIVYYSGRTSGILTLLQAPLGPPIASAG